MCTPRRLSRTPPPLPPTPHPLFVVVIVFLCYTHTQHFIFFAVEFDLLARKEMDPLEALVTPLVEEFNRGTIST